MRQQTKESVESNSKSLLTLLWIITASITWSLGQRFDHDPTFPAVGRFYQVHLLQMGMEHGNPKYRETDNWFRVNSPQVSLMKSIKHRYETRYNGLMMIWAEADITSISGAELYLELWGGHPGTHSKGVSVNGRTTYALPEVGSADHHCTHSYPTITLKTSDLVNGYNAFQFTCEKDSEWGWGHYILHDARLRLELPSDHPLLKSSGVEKFQARVKVVPSSGKEGIELSLDVPNALLTKIDSVSYQAFYRGYDENGNSLELDWHGLTHRRQDRAFAGRSSKAPFSVFWDTSMLPEQSQVAVRAILSFKGEADLTYMTPPTQGLRTEPRVGNWVTLHTPQEIPIPFWSRANRLKTCEIKLETSRIERAVLHISVWGGNPGQVKEYFTLNGHFIPIAPPKGMGPIWYHQIEVSPEWLKPGKNKIELLSDTEHHGIEVLRPGPALMVRYAE